MASSIPVKIEADLSQNSGVLSNISVADLLFYRAVELQTDLLQNYRNAIFNMVIVAADVAGRMPKSAARDEIKAAKAVTDGKKEEAEQALGAADKPPSETTSAERNLGNVVAATNVLMNNCVEALQQLDVIAEEALVQCLEMILKAAGQD